MSRVVPWAVTNAGFSDGANRKTNVVRTMDVAGPLGDPAAGVGEKYVVMAEIRLAVAEVHPARIGGISTVIDCPAQSFIMPGVRQV